MGPIRELFFDFRHSSSLLYNEEEFSKKTIVSTNFIPYIVNGAFCIEMGFKAIIEEEKKNVLKEHSLIKLFETFDDFDQRFILNKIISYGNSTDDSLKNFKSILKQISNNFIEWRYYYEKDSLFTNWLFIHDLIEAIASRFSEEFSDFLFENYLK